jgi:hypothetical protein
MLSAMIRGRMISPMTTVRPQQRYDHRLRELAQRTGDLTVATDLGVPRSTARGWLRTAPTVIVSLDVALTEPQLRQEILTLRRHVQKLAGLLRLALVLLRVSGFTLSGERLPDGADKPRILRAIDQARSCIPLRALLRLLRLSPSRFHAWRRRYPGCALDDQSSCPRTSPHRLTPAEIRVIEDLMTSPTHRHVPTGTRRPGPAARHRLGVHFDLVPAGAAIRLATAPAPRAPRQTHDRASNHSTRRDVAYRHHRYSSRRRDPHLSARRDRQLLTTDLGVARR